MATSMISGLSPHESARVEDYLNDKIQTAADFESLDSLLSNLRAQQELQRKQLVEAQEALEKATKASSDHADAVRKQAEAFNEQQADIDRRLMIITQSDTSDDAVRQFEASMEKLRRLDISKGYMELLKEIDGLSKEAIEKAKSAPSLALQPYTRLRNITSSLKDAQPAAEGAAPHLVDYTEKLASGLREQMRRDFSGRLQKVLEKMKWPGKDLIITDGLIKEWADCVELLLCLQEPELEPRTPAPGRQDVEPRVLLPLEVMAHPLELRFKYHFSGDKPTNRLDKPEYFLSHVTDLINTYNGFFASYLQPIFDERAQKVGSDLEWNYFNSTHAFITTLLPMLRQKITTFLPQISTHPQLLSHFIHELMNFDNEIRETWNYLPDPYSGDNWRGLTWEVLTKQGWFDRWLQVEKDFALSRYKDIIDAADSGHIDYDGVELTATKPTKAAIRVNDLLETITERYRPLSSFSQKLRFLIDIQITIFDKFHERLHSGLEAYLAMTSTIGRTVQGASADDQASLEGAAGLERLCRVFGSAEYLEKKMQDWSDDVFFLELWSELQERVRKNKDGGRNVAGPMSATDIASRTSQAVTNNRHKRTQSAIADGALFDETASAYRRLRLRSESIIASTLTSNAQSALRPYSRVSTWTSLSSSSTASSGTSSSGYYPLPPTSDLAPTIRTLSQSISFLSRALGVAPLRRITRQLLLVIQTYIWDNVLMRHTFSTAGAAQLASDVEHICSVVDGAMGPSAGTSSSGESEKVIRKLKEGLLLLGLRIKAHKHGNEEGVETEEQGDEEVELVDTAAQQGLGLGLWEVERRLFASNESAREVLAELEIETLTEAEARAVLERRVEVRS